MAQSYFMGYTTLKLNKVCESGQWIRFQMAGVSGVKLKFEIWFRMQIHVNQIQELYALGFPVESPKPDYILVDQLRDLRIHVYGVRD